MIHRSSFQGLPTLLIDTALARCEISLFGAQVLSFVPHHDGRDLLWCSSGRRAAGRPVRGGIPICWPWFAKQDRPPDAVQHGFVRTMDWRVAKLAERPDETVHVQLRLSPPDGTWPHGEGWPGSCTPEVELLIGQSLEIKLRTHNQGAQPLTLTQALHTYFRVGDVRKTRLDGLEGRRYLDKLRNFEAFTQEERWQFADACDRIYQATRAQHRLADPILERAIVIESEHSASTVLWNPGAQGITELGDVPPADWYQYLCIEAANCAPLDRIALAPGAESVLIQRIRAVEL